MRNLILIFLFGLCLPGVALAVTPFINEVHYDNVSTDQGEGIEIAGVAGTDLTGWTVVLYNGSNGTIYNTIILSGTIDDEGRGYGALWFDQAGIQNGAPDGFALVDNTAAVTQFLSYEGSFVAVEGPANGMTSTDIGVEETGETLVTDSLQLTGWGTEYEHFTWTSGAHTAGTTNTDQIFTTGGQTDVRFVATMGTVSEDQISIVLEVFIENEDPLLPVIVDVVLVSGDPAAIGNYTTQILTFPAGDNTAQILEITATDFSQDRILVLELQNVAGGNHVVVGDPGAFDLIIEKAAVVESSPWALYLPAILSARK